MIVCFVFCCYCLPDKNNFYSIDTTDKRDLLLMIAMSESRKRRNESVSFSEENDDESTDEGCGDFDNEDNDDEDGRCYCGVVGIKDNQNGYHSNNNDDEFIDDKENESKDDCDEDDDDDDYYDEKDEDRYRPIRRNEYYKDIDDHPLRKAICRYESPNIIITLIEEYMITAQKQQKQQKDDTSLEYLLHLACMRCRHISVVMKLLELFPDSVKLLDDGGSYPLHIACGFRQSEEVVMKLIELFPMAVQQQNKDTKYPLNLACSNGQSEHVVMKLIEIFPQAATHQVLIVFPPIGFVQAEGNDGYALHMACKNNQSLAVITKLIEINGMILYEKDYYGNYPPDCAIYGNNSNNVMKFLIDADPIALQRLNGEGRSPIHIAYRCRNVSFLEDMINNSDVLVNMTDRDGKTLLHYAFQRTFPFDECPHMDRILEMLLQHPYIDVNAKDKYSNTPLHYAAMSKNLRIVKILLNHPLLIIDEKNNENKTPLDRIKQYVEEQTERAKYLHPDDYPEDDSTSFLYFQLPIFLENIKLLEESLIKQRWKAYCYYLSTI